MLEYFIEKIPRTGVKKICELNNFEFFYGEIIFLSALFTEIVPFNKNIEQSPGLHLNAFLTDKITTFVKDRPLRKNISRAIFNNSEHPPNSLFLRLVISLSQQLSIISSSHEYNVLITINLHDRFMTLFSNLIQWGSFQLELKPNLACYFTLDLL